MQSAIFNTPVIKVESLKNKFDTLVLSGSFINLIGDYIEALFFQQLHYWSLSEYGVVIDDTRWIYKPLREWLSEVFTFLTEWKLRKAIASLLEKGLIERKKLYVKHHEIKHDNPYWNPKNQTYYYSVNYDELQKRIDAVEKAETTENVRIEDFTELSIEDFQDTKCCELSQNNTNITSIENNSKDLSHPHLPCVCETKKEVSQEQELSNPDPLEINKTDSVSPKVVEKDTNVERIEQKINQNKHTAPDVESAAVEPPKLKPKTPKGTKSKRRNQAPWKDEGQFKQFYRALIQALPIVANSHTPQGLAKVIIAQLKRGEEHSYWDDFEAGLPIGTTDKPEWEVEPGVPYPMFIEYLTEKIIKGNNTQTQEQARNEVFRILEKPRQAKAFWGQFKRSVVNVSEQVERDRALGVTSPNTPVWTRERIEPSVEEAAAAGQNISAVNDACQAVLKPAQTPQLESKDSPRHLTSTSLNKSKEVPLSSDPWSDRPKDTHCDRDERQPTMREILAERGVKGFCKPMPKVSREEAEAEAKAESEAIKRQQMNYKTHLNQMSLDEINELLKDPISRTELTPQLINSKYELITDYLGQIIRVKLSELSDAPWVQIREKRCLRLASQSQSLGE